MSPMTDPAKIIREFYKDVDLIIEDGHINGKGSEIRMFKSGIWERIR